MKRIGIVSYYFAPGNLMGAIRATKLAKYFVKKGYEVVIIASYDNKWLFLDTDVGLDRILLDDASTLNVLRVSHSLPFRIFASLIRRVQSFFKLKTANNVSFVSNLDSLSKQRSIKAAFLKFIMFLLSLVQDFDFLIQLILNRNARKQITSVDVLISSYGPYASHLAGFLIKFIKKGEIKWIADFRDPIMQSTDIFLQKSFNKRIQESICKKADYIVAVSEGYLSEITQNKHESKKNVITNGFDPDDLISPNSINITKEFNKKLVFSYTGTTYSGRRDLSPILLAISELHKENELSLADLGFIYAGPERLFVEKLFEEYRVSSILIAYDKIGRQDVIAINQQSDLLIVATWDDNNSKGVLPGKFFELLMFNKPIINLVSGNGVNSELTRLIVTNKLGFSYEKASHEVDILKLKDFLKCSLKDKKSLYSNYNAVDKFNYSNIANRYLTLIHSLYE